MAGSINLTNLTSQILHIQSGILLPGTFLPNLRHLDKCIIKCFLKARISVSSTQYLFKKCKSDYDNSLSKIFQLFVTWDNTQILFYFLLQALPNPSTSSFCHRPSRSFHCSHTAFFQLPKWTKLFLITRNLSMCYPHSRMLPPSYLIWLIQISQMLLSQNGLSHLTL